MSAIPTLTASKAGDQAKAVKHWPVETLKSAMKTHRLHALKQAPKGGGQSSPCVSVFLRYF